MKNKGISKGAAIAVLILLGLAFTTTQIDVSKAKNTLPCGSMPALTGDATSSAGSCNVTVSSAGGGLTTSSYTTHLFEQDDFCSGNTAAALGWTVNVASGSVSMLSTSDPSVNHPCLSLVSATNGNWAYYILGVGNTGQNYLNPQAQTFVLKAVLDNNGGSGGIVRFGLFDDRGSATDSNGVYFEASGGGSTPNWSCVTKASGTATTNSSGVTAPTNTWHTLEIDASATTSVVFEIDGSTVCTNSSNVVNNLLTAGFEANGNASGTANLLVDYFSMNVSVTR